MRFGQNLRKSVYGPWKDKYIDYARLKSLLRENTADEDDTPWTSEDENRFCDEIFNVQFEKVARFQEETFDSLRRRVDSAFDKLREISPTDDKPKGDIASGRLKELESELDAITNEVRELKKFSSMNYTGFLKIVKKHDRKRGDRYKVRPMMQLSLSKRAFNSEQAYSPLLNKISIMYYVIRQQLDEGATGDAPIPDLEVQEERPNGERYTAHKFWIHPDNLLEVKTYILRRLPTLVYSEATAKELDAPNDPTITALYFDSPKFDLYTRKVDRQVDASSLRLRWYGQLSSTPEIILEQKIINENGTSEEKKFPIKEKYIQQFINGEYRMEKTIQKMERQGRQAQDVDAFKSRVDEIQKFIQSNRLEPAVRANYVRTAFQKPADDRVRISIDTDIAFIREDTLDKSRPCRDTSDWHRTDIDNSNMTYPFKNINQSEVSRFPYAVLEIKVKEEGNRKRPVWVEDLMASHLLHVTPKFSKFVHGVATLFEDYVNMFPFWLSDVGTDIRKDPQRAFEEEEQRKAQRAEDAQVVGSFLGTKSASFKPAQSSPVAKSYLSERAAQEVQASRSRSYYDTRRQDAEGDQDENGDEVQGQQRNYGTLGSILPGFSLTKYARAKRQRERPLPEGVVEPREWIKNSGPLQIEPKVWLANERTFLKWQHICVLLGSLSLGLYTAAGENFLAECMGIAYIAIAIMAGLWGYFMLRVRRNMIVARSGKDFDNMIGPILLSVALCLALILNFVFAYRQAFAKFQDDKPRTNVTAPNREVFVGSLYVKSYSDRWFGC